MICRLYWFDKVQPMFHSYGAFTLPDTKTDTVLVSVSVLCEHLHTNLYKPFFISLVSVLVSGNEHTITTKYRSSPKSVRSSCDIAVLFKCCCCLFVCLFFED